MLRDGRVMLRLIEIKAGLLRVEEIEFKPQSVYFDQRRPRFPEQNPGPQFHAFRATDGRIVALNDRGGGEHLFRGFNNQCFPLIHRERQRLQNKLVAVAINDHARQPIAFTPDDAEQSFAI